MIPSSSSMPVRSPRDYHSGVTHFVLNNIKKEVLGSKGGIRMATYKLQAVDTGVSCLSALGPG